MKARLLVCLLAACALSGAAFRQPPAQEKADDKSLLPADAVWELRYDFKVDGELKDVNETKPRWRIVVVNNRITGVLADAKEGDTNMHRLTGEVVGGETPVVFLRQDGQKPRGYVGFHTGLRVEEGRVVGTWYDTRGTSGDFELAIVKK
jgi:hypothetical protein